MIRAIAKRLGYSIKPIYKSDDPSDHLRMICERTKVGLVVDCGANLGQFHGSVRRAGYRGRILCVEPNPGCHATLQDVVRRDGKTELLSIALGSEQREITLNVVGDTDGLTSTYDFNDLARERFKRAAKVSRKIPVEMKRLDSLLDSLSIAKDVPILLKTDTQGNDLQVLAGAGQRIDQIVGIHVEMAVRQLYRDGPTHWQILDFVRAHGFEPYDFSTVSRDSDGSLLEYDALFVRKEI